MVIDLYKIQLEELKKLSFNFYKLLAYGDEPLTYTIKTSPDDGDTQVEVNARFIDDKDNLSVEFGFDTDFGGRFSKAKGDFYAFTLSSDNRWTE